MDAFEVDECIEVKRLYKTTRYLHYVIKFIIRSRILYTAMNGNADYEEFANKLHGWFLINSILLLFYYIKILVEKLHCIMKLFFRTT